MRRVLWLLPFLLCLSSAAAQEMDWGTYQDEAVRRLSRYLQVNTSNPPGNELAGAHFFQQWFEAEGIEVEIFEIAPGRANLIARLRGDGSKRPLILANHTDVVRANPEAWRVEPFSGAIVDGYVYGRGALDMKGLGLRRASRCRSGYPHPAPTFLLARGSCTLAFRSPARMPSPTSSRSTAGQLP